MVHSVKPDADFLGYCAVCLQLSIFVVWYHRSIMQILPRCNVFSLYVRLAFSCAHLCCFIHRCKVEIYCRTFAVLYNNVIQNFCFFVYNQYDTALIYNASMWLIWEKRLHHTGTQNSPREDALLSSCWSRCVISIDKGSSTRRQGRVFTMTKSGHQCAVV